MKNELASLARKCEGIGQKVCEAQVRVDQIRDIRSVPNIQAAIEAVKSAKAVRAEAKIPINSLITFLRTNREELYREDPQTCILLTGAYGATSQSLQEAIDDHLDSYQALLEYSLHNHAAILLNNRSAVTRHRELHSSLERANNKRWTAYSEHQNFLLRLAEEYPEIKGLFNQAQEKIREIETSKS